MLSTGPPQPAPQLDLRIRHQTSGRRQSPGLRPIDLEATPEEVALGLRHLGGLAFLDSSSAPASGALLSLVTARPPEVLRGRIDVAEDRGRLRQVVGEQAEDSTASQRADLALPAGGLLGQVGFAGDFVFGHYTEMLVFDHGQNQWWECGDLSAEIDAKATLPAPPGRLEFVHDSGREAFLEAVRTAREYIAAGDIYQVNLAHRFSADWPGEADPLGFYSVLRRVSPVPHAAYLELDPCRPVLSASPECFLKMSGRSILTRPIKGTRPRFRDPDLDQKSAYDLLTSPKEIAELVMITDLERNDLGRICEFGSVRTDEFLKLEAFEQVYHRVSTVSGWLREEIDHVEALHLCSPGGSISGAPKRRALEIIDELEPHPRDLYTGAIGYLGGNGESQFSIAIRTAEVIDGDRILLHVGSGIVADSDPEAEYEETLHKAEGFFRAALG